MYVPSQSVFMIYLQAGGIFPTSSAVARSRFSAGVAITNISMQLALLHSELDNLTYNWTSRHGTGYTFTWPRPTVEPAWVRSIEKTTGSLPHGRPRVRSGNCYPSHGVVPAKARHPERCEIDLKNVFFNLFYEMMSLVFSAKLALGECHRIP